MPQVHQKCIGKQNTAKTCFFSNWKYLQWIVIYNIIENNPLFFLEQIFTIISVAKIVLIILGSMVASDMVSDPSNMASDAASKVTSDLISDFASNFASNLTSNLASDLTSNEKADLPSNLSSRWAPFVKICCLLNHVTLLAWNSFKDLFWNKSLGMKKKIST